MSQDGADMGVTADRALETVLGGADQPTQRERMTPEQMRDWLLTAPRATEPEAAGTYTDCARAAGGEVLRWALVDRGRFDATPPETEITWPVREDGSKDYENPIYGRLGVYDLMKAEGIPLAELGLTGFQWGWAMNAARYALGAPPVPNPAIVTVGGDQ